MARRTWSSFGGTTSRVAPPFFVLKSGLLCKWGVLARAHALIILLEGHAPLYRKCVYNLGIMTAPIQFASQEAFEQAVGAILKDKLSFEVSSRTDQVDISHGEYVEMKTYKVSVQLDGETITEFLLD